MDLASEGAYGPADHLWLLQDYALALAGRRTRRLIVQMPPRHGKSTFLSHYFPAWWLGRFPDQRVILCSAVAERAQEWGAKARDAMNAYGEPVFGVRVSRQYGAAARDWAIEAHLGSMMTTGIGGPITGRGADLLVIDDPLKNAEEADSPLIRDRQWDWLLSTALPRLEPGGVVVLIMARWHHDDLAGRCLREQPDDWTLLNLPALAEPQDPLDRAEGAPLWPERYDLAALAPMQRSRWWDALYQGHPTPLGGATFSRAWWDQETARYGVHGPAEGWHRRAIGRWLCFDTALKDRETSDYTACCVLELLPDYRLLLWEAWQERLEFPELVASIEHTALRYYQDGKLRGVVIEDKASGTSAYQTLRQAAPDWLAPLLVAFQPRGSKQYRARQASYWCERSLVLLPVPGDACPWLYDFSQQLFTFPSAAHDDYVDAFVMGILYLEHLLAEGYHLRQDGAQPTNGVEHELAVAR